MISFEQKLSFRGDEVQLNQLRNGLAQIEWTDVEEKNHLEWVDTEEVVISELATLLWKGN